MFIIRQCYKPLVRSLEWRGRCGAIHLYQDDPSEGKHMSLYILGLHAHHGDPQIDTFSDVGYLLKHGPWGSKVLVAGDWSVDQLPALDGDPYNLKAGRDTHHKAGLTAAELSRQIPLDGAPP